MKLKRRLKGDGDIDLITCLKLFPKSDLRKIVVVILVQIFFSILDLIGVALLGILSALAINGLQARPPGDKVSLILEYIHLQNQTLQFQATVIGGLAAGFLIFKTILSILIFRRILFFLSRKSAIMSRNLLSRIFERDLLAIQSKSNQEFLYSLTTGMSNITVGIVGTLVLLISDAALVVILGFGLFVLDPVIAMTVVITFASLGLILFQLMKNKASRIGKLQSLVSVKSSETIIQSLSSYRELIVKNRRDYFVKMISNERMVLSEASAELSFLPHISKYVLEIAIVIGGLTISVLQFTSKDSVHAISVLVVFLVASTRLAPAILRLQQGATSIRANLGSAKTTFAIIEEFGIVPRPLIIQEKEDFNYEGFVPTIKIENLFFSYPNTSKNVISNFNLNIPSGKIVAFVGPSGGGKSTLIDLILGILNPASGKVTISSVKPIDAISIWPGAISYVPQDIQIINGTVQENITFGYDSKLVDQSFIREALQIAQISQFVSSLPLHLDTHVGDRGTKLSGGQRQRIGLARAMYSQPNLLVLDEATSALDGETESNIATAINNMRGSRTILVVAHRLATVRNADIVVYLEDGQLIAQGTFDEVKQAVPNFANQAALLGL